jgi:hypothetical protein
MPCPSWTRGILKWTGTVFCLLLVAIGAASFWVCLEWVPIDHLALGMGNGNFTVVLNSTAVGASPYFATWSPRSLDAEDIPNVLWPESASSIGACRIPLWIPLAFIAVPTLVAWRHSRPLRLGFCHNCGYNLTGNTTGRCPECGTPAPPASLAQSDSR